jgi:hypothetical protein
MTRIASKLGMAAALTLGVFSTAAAQATGTAKPTTTVGVAKGEVVTPVVKVETVTVVRRDTVIQYRRDTVTVTGPTMTRWDTVTVLETPGWLNRGSGTYFGLGAGAYYPSGGLGGGQIPGYAFQMNLGIDPAGSPLGARITAQLARPDESQPYNPMGARPTVMNFTGDLKLRLPFFNSTRFPQFGLYGVGGLAYVRYNGIRMTRETDGALVIENEGRYSDSFGYSAGGGATMGIGHKRELFLEARVINWNKASYESNHQLPIILGINWY